MLMCDAFCLHNQLSEKHMVEYICGPHSFVGGIYVDSQREMKVEILSGPSDKRKEKKKVE